MEKFKVIGFIFLFSLGFITPLAAVERDSILGRWWNETKEAQISIYPCNAKICGKLVFLRDPVYPATDNMGMAGKPKLDRENPEASRRDRPLIGIMVLSDLTYTGNRVWDKGTIYNPDNGKKHQCRITLDNPNRLKIREYTGTPIFFGRTQYWMRVK